MPFFKLSCWCGLVPRHEDAVVGADHQEGETGMQLNHGIHLVLLRWKEYLDMITIGSNKLGVLVQGTGW